MSDKIRDIIAAAINVPADTVTDALTMLQSEAWDSLKHMEIIVGLEREFSLELTFDEIVEMKSVGDIRRVLAAHGKGLSMEIQGKQAIVTGGVRGLGRAIVAALVAKGAAVTVLDLDADGLATLAREDSGITTALCDVSNETQVAAAMEAFHANHRAADILVNNAGILHSTPLVRLGAGGLERHSVNAWSQVLASNLTSVFLMSSYVVERMVTTRTRGVIVNISSVSAAGNSGQSAYSAAKAGVNALTAAWAKELGPLGIRAVAIAPGFADTESTRKAVSENVLKETVGRVPLRRLGQPAEIAQAVIAAIENDFFNGKVLAVDGGLVV